MRSDGTPTLGLMVAKVVPSARRVGVLHWRDGLGRTFLGASASEVAHA